SQRAMRLALVPPMLVKSFPAPAAISCGGIGPPPSGSHESTTWTLAFEPLFGRPEPRGCHAEPSHRAIFPSGLEPECWNSPPAINAGGSGPSPSGSHDV